MFNNRVVCPDDAKVDIAMNCRKKSITQYYTWRKKVPKKRARQFFRHF